MFSTQNLYDVSMASSCTTRRSSSYDKTGANIDFCRIPAGGKITLLDVDGPGIITHLWFALTHMDFNYLRTTVIRAWWDGQSEPSINCPLGDFFGAGHAVTNKYSSLLMNMVRGTGIRGESTGVNCYIPMPFENGARIEIINESVSPFQACYYMVDWLEVPVDRIAGAGRFHALWRRENPKAKTPVTEESYIALGRFGCNTDGKDNYTVADIKGAGRFLGMNLSIDNIDSQVLDYRASGFGEGDELIFIDGEGFPPSLHGTGTEDYFCNAWGMSRDAGLYAGTSVPHGKAEGSTRCGTCYRFHTLDPVFFKSSLLFSFENGPNNCQANDLSSTAYWYQEAARGCPLAPVELRLPRPDINEPEPGEEKKAVEALGRTVDSWYDVFIEGTRSQVVACGRDPAGSTIGAACRIRNRFAADEITTDEVASELAPYEDAINKIKQS